MQTGQYFEKRRYDTPEWKRLRQKVEKEGIRNGWLIAVAPTSSTSMLAGTTAGLDPIMNRYYLEEKKNGLVPRVAPDLSPRTFWNPMLSASERRAYDKILSFLVFLDSIQTANLPAIGEYITANEVNLCLSIQTFQEAVHSQSYSYILDTICEPQMRNDVLYQWKTDGHLLERNRFIGDRYNEFQKDKNPFTFMKTMVANYILEGIYFYSGFLFFIIWDATIRCPGQLRRSGTSTGTRTPICGCSAI